MNRILLSLFTALFPFGASAQSEISSPSPFSLSSQQLLQPTGIGEEDRTGSAFYAEFDEFGNRIVDLTPGAMSQTVNYSIPRSVPQIATDLGPQSLIRFTPILSMPLNPEELRPTIDVLTRIGHLDVAKPAISYGLVHDSNITLAGTVEPVATTRNDLGTEIRIETARDRARRTRFRFGYRPTLARHFKYTQLDSLNHQALLSIIIPFRRVTIGFATAYSKANTSSLLLGGGTESTGLANSVRFDADLGGKLTFSSQAGYTTGEQSQPLVSQFVATSAQKTTSTSLNANLNYTKNEKLSFTTGFAVTMTRQNGLDIGIAQLGGNLNTVSPSIGFTYSPSEKFQTTVSVGLVFNDVIDTGETSSDDSISISAVYRPWSSWIISTSIGTATLTQPALGFSTSTQSATVSVAKTIYRQITGKLDYTVSNQSALGSGALSTTIGDITQASYSGTLSARTSQRTSINLSYINASVDSAGALGNQKNTTISFNLQYQF